jgi:hypothetical protein
MNSLCQPGKLFKFLLTLIMGFYVGGVLLDDYLAVRRNLEGSRPPQMNPQSKAVLKSSYTFLFSTLHRGGFCFIDRNSILGLCESKTSPDCLAPINPHLVLIGRSNSFFVSTRFNEQSA